MPFTNQEKTKERKTGMKNITLYLTASVIILTGSSVSAALTTDYTKTAGAYNWSNTNIWSLGILPEGTNYSAQIRKGTTLTGDVDANVGEIRIFEASTLTSTKDITVNAGDGTGQVLVGYNTTGTLNVASGTLNALRTYYGQNNKGYGTISGGTLVSPDLFVGYGNTSIADVTQSGGQVRAKNGVFLNYNVGANGVYHFQSGTLTTASLEFRSQNGSTNPFDWTGGTLKATAIAYTTNVTGSLLTFNQAAGILDPTKFNGDGSVNEISVLTVSAGGTNAANYALSAAGVLQMQLAGTDTNSYDKLVVEGSFTAGGTLSVSLTNGFSVTLGDTFNIIDANSFSGSFSNIYLPTLSGGLGWDTANLMSTGTITVIPEPASVGLFVVSGVGILILRRRLI
jgi:hypothetical protein